MNEQANTKEQFDAVSVTAIYDLNCLCEDILQAARHATGPGYVIYMIGFNYRVTPQLSARLHIFEPGGKPYAALIKWIESDGWVLDHKSDWHKLGKHDAM